MLCAFHDRSFQRFSRLPPDLFDATRCLLRTFSLLSILPPEFHGLLQTSPGIFQQCMHLWSKQSYETIRSDIEGGFKSPKDFQERGYDYTLVELMFLSSPGHVHQVCLESFMNS